MNPLRRNPSKSEEIEHLKKFAATVPDDTYLHTLLHHILPQFEADVRNDFPCLPDLRQIEQDIVAAQDKLKALKKQEEELTLAAYRLEKAQRSAVDSIQEVVHTAFRIAQTKIPPVLPAAA